MADTPPKRDSIRESSLWPSRAAAGLGPIPGPHLATSGDAAHIDSNGLKRETNAILRLMALDSRRLGELFELGPLIWCAVDVPYGLLEDAGSAGDVDLILGEFDFSLSEKEWETLIQSRRTPFDDDETTERLALVRSQLAAFEAGWVHWPPDFSRCVALEVKYSHAEVDAQGRIVWHATHTGGGSRRAMKGKLARLRRCGFARSGLLHIGTLRPFTRTSGIWGILQASGAASAALETMPDACSVDRDQWYVKAMLTAVPEFLEFEAGTAPKFDIRSRPSASRIHRSAWASNLCAHLELLGKPQSSPVFFLNRGTQLTKIYGVPASNSESDTRSAQ